jgi:hypothetical protein
MSVSQRTNHIVPEVPEPGNNKSITQIEGALREFVGQEVRHPRRDPKLITADAAANIESLAQRATTLGELRNVIQELQHLHDFLETEGDRIQREIAEYAQVSRTTANSTRLIADNMLNWKKSKELAS